MQAARETDRLGEAGARARAAEAQGDDMLAGEEWRRYRLIKDAARNPDERVDGVEALICSSPTW